MVLGALVLVHALLVWLVLGGHLSFLFNDATHRLGRGTDFNAYYNAAQGFADGKSMYGKGPGYGFRYHPLFAIVLSPIFPRIGPAASYWIWIGLNEALLLVSIALIRLRAAGRRFLVLAAAFLLFSPYLLELFMGNASFLVGALIFLGLEMDRRGRAPAFATLLSVSIIIKPIGLVVLPILALQRRYRLATGITLAVIVPALVYFLTDSFGRWYFGVVNFQAVPSPGWVMHAGNQGLHAFVLRVLSHLDGVATAELTRFTDLSPVSTWIIRVWPLAVTLATLLAAWPLRRRPALLFFLWSGAYILGYKDVWEHSYAFMLFPFAAVLLSDDTPGRGVFWICLIALALPSAFAFYDLPLAPGPNDPEHEWGIGTALVHHIWRPLPVLIPYAMIARVGLLRFRRGGGLAV